MRFLHVFTYICLMTGWLSAQWLERSPESSRPDMPVLQDTLYQKANFYDQAQNPAALMEDEGSPALWFGSFIKYADGAYHLPFAPEITNNQNYAVQVIRPLSERDIFKGYFNYRRNVDQSVKWAHQSRLLEQNPFMLADSSTGNFTLNGLNWSGEWAHRFSRRLMGGLAFYYNVDQRLKQVFPKPEDRHRDVNVRVGSQYQWGQWKTGFTYRYYNEQEKVEITKYNLDQNLTPYLYKFRYSDIPIVLTGKTSEQRKIEYSGHYLNFQTYRPLGQHSGMLASAGYNKSSGLVEDGGTERQSQGQFQWEKWDGRLLFYRQIAAKTSLRFTYRVAYQQISADHPDFGFRIMEEPSSSQQALLSLKQEASKTTSFFLDAGYGHQWLQHQDFVTVNYYEYRYHQILLRLGALQTISNRWELQTWSGFSRYFHYGESNSNNIYSDFFDVLLLSRLNYYSSRTASLDQGLRVTYHYGPLLDVEFTGQYLRTLAEDYSPRSNSREEMLLSLWFKVFIF